MPRARVDERRSNGLASPRARNLYEAAAVNAAALETPLGRIGVAEQDGCIVRVLWWGEDQGERTAVLEAALTQLAAYFSVSGDRGPGFDLPLAPQGSTFQQRVWAEMRRISRGETRTYGDLAAVLGTTAQEVGQACGTNPIPIIVPCHRVVGSNGLGGFSAPGGIETKVWLLRHEGAYSLLI